jgi:hypothetical protein
MPDSKPTTAFLPIPTARALAHADAESSSGTPSSYDTTTPSSYTSSSPSPFQPAPSSKKAKGSAKGKGKGKAPVPQSPTAPPPTTPPPTSSFPLASSTPPNNRRRNSLYFDPSEDNLYRYPFLSPSFQKRDEICVNVGTDDHPRLVALIASAQGYEFNKANFLPPRFLREEYGPRGGYDFEVLRGGTEVVEIEVSEEERRQWFLDDC